MKNIKTIISAALVGVMAISFAGCNLVGKTPEAIQKTVLAKVGDKKITKADLDTELPIYVNYLSNYFGMDAYSSEDSMYYCMQMGLQSLVEQQVLLQMGSKLNLAPKEEELNTKAQERLAEVKAGFTDEESYQAALKAANLDEATFLDNLKSGIIIETVQESTYKDAEVTDADVNAYYNDNLESFIDKAAGANMYHILVKTEDEAKDIKAKLDGGASFSDLAKEFGTDGTKDEGGALGFVAYNQSNFDKDFLAAAKTLSEGQISDPVKTQFGYHIIKVDGIVNETTYIPLEKIREDVEADALENKKMTLYNDSLEQWKKELNTKTYEDRLKDLTATYMEK